MRELPTISNALVLIVFIFLVYYSSSYAQTDVKLSKPQLELHANNINIYYDILNSSPTDKFRIRLEISDSTGNAIYAKFISGDIGDNVSGGSDKTIIWNFVADSIFLDNGIYVQVYAENISIIVPPDVTESQLPAEDAELNSGLNRGRIVFQSLIFPGLGLSRIKGNPHWLKGVVGYGCLAASYMYNKQAVSSYDDYLNTESLTDQDRFYNNSVEEDNLSEIFTYGAIGIWVLDFVWTFAGSSEFTKNQGYSQLESFSIKTVYNSRVHTPMLALSYNF